MNTKIKFHSQQHCSHPWHGVSIGSAAPKQVTCYIEIVPTDTVKYEVDKETGILKVDRPHAYSSQCPSLYGFIPQTYCGDRVAAITAKANGVKQIKGDGDPLDICVLTEKQISHGNILVRARPIGGFRLLDKNEADDKIIAVLEDDLVYGGFTSIKQISPRCIDRLKHYFLTYKEIPTGSKSPRIVVSNVYDSKVAMRVITESMIDYSNLIKSN